MIWIGAPLVLLLVAGLITVLVLLARRTGDKTPGHGVYGKKIDG